MVPCVSDEDEAVAAPHHDPFRRGKSRRGSSTAAAIDTPGRAGESGKSGDRTVRRDFTDHMVARISHINRAVCCRSAGVSINCHAFWGRKSGCNSKCVGGARHPGSPGQGADDPCRSDSADRVIAGVRHIDIAGAVQSQRIRIVKRSDHIQKPQLRPHDIIISGYVQPVARRDHGIGYRTGSQSAGIDVFQGLDALTPTHRSRQQQADRGGPKNMGGDFHSSGGR